MRISSVRLGILADPDLSRIVQYHLVVVPAFLGGHDQNRAVGVIMGFYRRIELKKSMSTTPSTPTQ